MDELTDPHHDRENAKMIERAHRLGWIDLSDIKQKVQTLVSDKLDSAISGELPDRNAIRWAQAGISMVSTNASAVEKSSPDQHLHLHGDDQLGKALDQIGKDQQYVDYLRDRAVDDDAGALRSQSLAGEVVSSKASEADRQGSRSGDSASEDA